LRLGWNNGMFFEFAFYSPYIFAFISSITGAAGRKAREAPRNSSAGAREAI